MRYCLSSIAVVVAVLATAATAEGQYVGRSYRGLFGSGLQGTNQSLTFDGRLGGGFDTNVLTAEPVAPGGPNILTTTHGSFGQAAAGLSYRLKLSKVNLAARLGGNASHYEKRVQPLIKTYAGDVNASVPLWSGANVSANYSMAFRPFYYLPWLAGAVGVEEAEGPAPPIDETAGTIIEYHTNTWTSAGFSQTLTRRMSLSATYGYQQSESDSGNRDLVSHTGSAGVNYTIGKGLGVNVGYGFTQSSYASSQSYRSGNINFGLNFNKALSITRKTTVSFTTGMSGVSDQSNTTTYYRLDLHAVVNHELGRTWTAFFLYNRDVSFDDAFRVPVPMDSFTLAVRGMFSRKLAFHSSVGTVMGALGFETTTNLANNFETYYARTGLMWGFSRNWGVGTDYTYFQYRFDAPTGLPSGMVRRADRQHVRAFLSYRATLFSGHSRGS